MDVVVFGAGSLGSLIGGLLARDHDVTLVGRDPHVRAVRDGGLRITGTESFTARPDALTDGAGLAADLVVVTVKAFDTPAAARELATGEFDAVLSLQNGMGNEDVLDEHLSCPILAGTTTMGAVLSGPGVVEWRGRGDIEIGPWRDAVDGTGRDADYAAERAVAGFRTAGIDATLAADVRAALWRKLAINAAVNPATALARVENGALVESPAADVVEPIAAEVARVARAEGVDLGADEAAAAITRVARATAENRSSMHQDVVASRRTEIDAIAGYVVERAERHGLAVPVTRTLRALVRAWEDARGLR